MKRKQNKKLSRTKIIFIGITAILIVGQLIFNIKAFTYMQQAHAPAIIPLLTTSIKARNQSAAVDAKTGDNYFPEARLYTAHQANQPTLRYSYNDSENPVLSITSSAVLSGIESKLWSAYATDSQDESKAMDNVFAAMPGSQACARGVQIFYEPQTREQLALQFETKLTNGKTAYGYTEPACKHDLTPIVEAAKTIRSY